MRAEKLLIKGLKALNIKPSDDQVSCFMTYIEELRRWSRAMNLTSIKDDRDIVLKHFVDSCLYLKVLPEAVGSVADVGSGAGFPGIPLKIMRPDLQVHLIESSGKKCSFLRHMQRTFKLDGLEVTESRVEDAEDMEVDAALTRATFSVEEFINFASHIVKDGGLFIMSKGPKVREEMNNTNLDYKLVTVPLPLTEVRRNFIIVEKG